MWNIELVIYPSKYNSINCIDEDYSIEEKYAKKHNLMTSYFNFDDFTTFNKKLKVSIEEAFTEPVLAVYRGWMMSVEDYTRFYNELKALYNIELITTPEQYENTHYFIKSYDKIKEHTPKTIWFSDNETIDWDKVRHELGEKFIVKDYVKSVKGFDFPEYLESNMSNEELDNYINKFREIRGNLFAGGIVLKQYVELDIKNGHTHEFRAFYNENFVMILYHNSCNTEDIIQMEQTFEWKADLTCIDSPFYTVDFARLDNGDIIVIEIGDGQVSGVPDNMVEYLYIAISHKLRK